MIHKETQYRAVKNYKDSLGQDLTIEFNKEIKTLKKIHVEMEMELKHPITHLENSNESLTSRLN